MQSNNTIVNNVILTIAILASAAAALMIFGSSLGLWEPIVGFGASRKYNDYLGWLVVALALVGGGYSLFTKSTKSGVIKPLLALILGLIIVSNTIKNWIVTPVRYPPIHDITTNIDNPPAFMFLDDSRPGAKNSLIYGGEEVAAAQQKAYPMIQPLITHSSAEQAYQRALKVANDMGWEIVAQDPARYHFESTARTPYFNFADDVVVEISEVKQGSRVDIRSVSRIGRSDRGVNAQRIIKFSEQFIR